MKAFSQNFEKQICTFLTNKLLNSGWGGRYILHFFLSYVNTVYIALLFILKYVSLFLPFYNTAIRLQGDTF